MVRASLATCTVAPRAGSEKLVAFVQQHSPWEWSGVSGLVFGANGELSTPWGKGRWGPLGDGGNALFADFVGSMHNLQFNPQELERFTSSRCGDGEPVIGKLAQGRRR